MQELKRKLNHIVKLSIFAILDENETVPTKSSFHSDLLQYFALQCSVQIPGNLQTYKIAFKLLCLVL